MGQQQSRDELVHELVSNGNVEAIKALHREGVGLEWIDREGKTPLIVACMDPRLYTVAKTLIELGANVNAYRPGRHAGTPLHHAAKRGLDQTVKLLLSHGANALVRNDDCQTPLDVARAKGYSNVVRSIENHICYFAGWLREIYGPGFLEALAPQLLSRKIWAVVIPCGSNIPTKPLKLQLVIYTTLQDAQPRTVIALLKAKIEEPKFHQSDPALIIFDNSTKTRYKLASASEGDRSEIQRLYNACRGIPQGMAPPVIHDAQTSVAATATQTAAEAAELAMAISASVQSASGDRPSLMPNVHQNSEASNKNGWGNSADNASHNGWGLASGSTHSEASSSGWINEPANEKCNGWGAPESGTTGNPAQHNTNGWGNSADNASHNGWGLASGSTHSEACSSGWINEPANEKCNGWGAPESGATGNPTQHNTSGWGSSTDNNSHNGWHPTGGLKLSEASSSGLIDKPVNEEYNGWGVPESGATGNPALHIQTQDKIPPTVSTSNEIPASFSSDPSAPPIPEEGLYEGPIHYPSIDLSPVDLSVPAIEAVPSKASDGDNGGDSSSCVICWEAPVEGACIPCGHMAGCMSCLNEIKAKKGVCPVCRTKMDKVIKLYAV